MFNLGNFAVKEILRAVAQNFDGDLLYTLDELNNANIEITAESTDITDHRGNVIRTTYNSKQGSFTAENALLSPAVLNASSGSDIELASATNKIAMPKFLVVAAGTVQNVPDAKVGTIKVMGLYNNGANGAVLRQDTTAVVDVSFAYDGTAKTVTVPDMTTDDNPSKYLIVYERDVESGMKLMNSAEKFPDAVKLTCYAAIMDPCKDALRAGYIVLPSLSPSPEMTISLDAENQTVEFQGNLNVDYCGNDKVLYYIYFPDENAVVTGGSN